MHRVVRFCVAHPLHVRVAAAFPDHSDMAFIMPRLLYRDIRVGQATGLSGGNTDVHALRTGERSRCDLPSLRDRRRDVVDLPPLAAFYRLKSSRSSLLLPSIPTPFP